MSQISPPIRILLVCAVAFLAAWMLFLRPKSDAGVPDTTPTPAATTPVEAGGEKAESLAGKAVEQANDAAATQNARTEELEAATGGSAATPATNATAGSTPADAGTPATGSQADLTESDTGLPLRVLTALGDKKVVVLLFWNPKAAEDKAVRKALRGIDRHHNKVLAHATNVKKIAAYQQITRDAEVKQSPTIIVVDRDRAVSTRVGYVDRTTIDQAVTDALRSP